jgi:murein endopeptidase
LPTVAALLAAVVGTALMVAWNPAEPLVAAPEPLAVQDVRMPPPAVDPPVRTTELPAASTAASEPAMEAAAVEEVAFPRIHWRQSVAIGVPHAGRLLDGVRLPVEGPGWVTWDPVLNRVPNRANRLFGTDKLVRRVLRVIREYRLAHPKAPAIVIGDLSRRGGGEIDEHVSHENGLDVDVYYPRVDHRLRPPTTVAQIDMRLAQDLLDRFVASGVQVVFVGYSTRFRGPSGVVVPYPGHNNHMHVRLAGAAVRSD